jgi:hypothetical protein
MADVVMDAYTKAYNDSGKMIQAFGVITAAGAVKWQSNNWDLRAEAKNLVAAVAQKASSVVLNSVKYSTMRSSPDSLVAKNLQGSGILVLAKIDADKWVVAWANPAAAPDGIYVDVDRAAKSLKGKVPG